MASTYRGFTVEQMLIHLRSFCSTVKLESLDQGWRLYCYSEEHGEYENEGALFFILSKAFDPFVEDAREKVKGTIEALWLSAH
ncbi:hypothetical protein [Pseudoalteromonas sp. BDTF-M6]|uniref:hypothetical protein n=1 Tax=Pseudoalteromonas sp. BDTF-M6 TaxID=2796132 RepID=UPI001BAF271A|nr:hypothetical protein [Pseudoalteromonas sp. BDTF-M6]MBS3796684.1 hypothetical protein [Pseudoalteromonas sp. BDTF-M6]